MTEGGEVAAPEEDAVAVRIPAAEFLLTDERDRGQGLNARGTATAAAGVALVALARDPISTALKGDKRGCFAEALLDISASYILVATGLATIVVLLGVLRPKVFELPSDTELSGWLENPRMKDSADAARYSVLAGVVRAVIARRRLNEMKADWLGVVYRLQVSALASTLLMLGTLVL